MRGVVVVVIFGALVLASAAFATDAEATALALARADAGLIALAVGLSGVNFLLRFLRWQRYLRALAIPIRRVESVRIFFVGFLLSVTPGKVGELAKAAMVEEASGQDAERVVAAVLAERYTDLLGMLVLASVGATVLPAGLWLAGIGGVGALFVYGLVAWRGVGDALVRIVERLGPGRRVAPAIARVLESLRTLLRPAELGVGVGLAFGAWAAQAGSLMLSAAAIGMPIGFLHAAFTYAVSVLVGVATLVPGGIGVAELSMGGVLHELAGLPSSEAVATTILTRLVTLWLAVVLGAFAAAFSFHRGKGDASRRG